jgi:uncharacterized membrane protein
MAEDTRVFEVGEPAETLYRKWSRFEGLQDYSPSLKEIRPTGERTAHVTIELFGERHEWDAEITRAEESRRLEWVSTSGLQSRGEVLFESLGPQRTRITVHYAYQPHQDVTGDAEYDTAISLAR